MVTEHSFTYRSRFTGFAGFERGVDVAFARSAMGGSVHAIELTGVMNTGSASRSRAAAAIIP